jgi:hypothetical protein
MKMPDQAPEPHLRRSFGGHGNNPAILVTIRASSFAEATEDRFARLTPSASVAHL